MNGDDLFTGNGEDAVDQWTLDQTSGAAVALQTHWVCMFSQEILPIKGRGKQVRRGVLVTALPPVLLIGSWPRRRSADTEIVVGYIF